MTEQSWESPVRRRLMSGEPVFGITISTTITRRCRARCDFGLRNRPAGVLGKDRRQDSGAGIERNASLTFGDDFYTVDLALNAARLQRRVEII